MAASKEKAGGDGGSPRKVGWTDRWMTTGAGWQRWTPISFLVESHEP